MEYFNTFISYRRTCGANEATLLYYALREKGVSVFMDVRHSEVGRYPERIERILNQCDNLVLVLAGDTLQQCDKEGDWVCRELLMANQGDKRIIPVYFPNANVDFQNLPDIIKDIKIEQLQAVEYTHEHSFSVINQLISYLNNSINRWECVELLLKNLDSKCKMQGLGKFILGSSEMRQEPKCEVHLLTNNLIDYDLTVIAEMAISTNINKEIKYIYYCPVECQTEFEELRSRISWYLGKKANAMNEVDRWIRAYYIANSELYIWLNRINKVKTSTIINDFFSSLCDDCQKKVQEKLDSLSIKDLRTGKEQIDVSFLIEWINGEIKTTPKIERIVSTFHLLLSDVCIYCEHCNDFSLNEWKKNCDFLYDLLISSKWIVHEMDEMKEDALNFLNKIGVDEQIIFWLEREPIENEEEIKDKLKNLYFCELDERRVPIKCCYSFSLLLNPDGSINASGWYKASARNIDIDSQNVKENMLMIKGLDSEQRYALKDIIKSILNQNIDFRKMVDSCIFKI